MKLFFLYILTFSTLLSAYNIDQMLDLYRKDSDLSNKTKKIASLNVRNFKFRHFIKLHFAATLHA